MLNQNRTVKPKETEQCSLEGTMSKIFTLGPVRYLTNPKTNQVLEFRDHPSMSVYLIRDANSEFYEPHKWLSVEGLKKLKQQGWVEKNGL